MFNKPQKIQHKTVVGEAFHTNVPVRHGLGLVSLLPTDEKFVEATERSTLLVERWHKNHSGRGNEACLWMMDNWLLVHQPAALFAEVAVVDALSLCPFVSCKSSKSLTDDAIQH